MLAKKVKVETKLEWKLPSTLELSFSIFGIYIYIYIYILHTYIYIYIYTHTHTNYCSTIYKLPWLLVNLKGRISRNCHVFVDISPNILWPFKQAKRRPAERKQKHQ